MEKRRRTKLGLAKSARVLHWGERLRRTEVHSRHVDSQHSTRSTLLDQHTFNKSDMSIEIRSHPLKRTQPSTTIGDEEEDELVKSTTI